MSRYRAGGLFIETQDSLFTFIVIFCSPHIVAAFQEVQLREEPRMVPKTLTPRATHRGGTHELVAHRKLAEDFKRQLVAQQPEAASDV